MTPGLPTAVIGLVCRDKTKKTKRAGLVVERRLVGESEAPFVDLELSNSGIRCIQLRDIIRYYDAWERCGILYGGLVELIVNAMTDVPEGFLEWEFH